MLFSQLRVAGVPGRPRIRVLTRRLLGFVVCRAGRRGPVAVTVRRNMMTGAVAVVGHLMGIQPTGRRAVQAFLTSRSTAALLFLTFLWENLFLPMLL